MATFYNQATLSYGNVVRTSNVAEGEIISGIAISKIAITESYSSGSGINYLITITNNGESDITGITLSDDLGAYTDGVNTVIPLSYVVGSILYYINGIPQTAPSVTETNVLLIEGISVPAGGNAILIYEALANGYAPLSQGATITNTVTGTGSCDTLTANATVATRDEAQLSIAKAVSPATVTCGGELEYTFIIQNTGNTAAVATDNVVIADIFDPILNNITVTLNGVALIEGTDYTYNTTTGEFSTIAGIVTVPAAIYNTDETGRVITAPGVTSLTISGTI